MGSRVGILTLHRCINYGSYWQARCLLEGLRAGGHDAFLLDHISHAVDRQEWRCAFQPLLPARTSRRDFPLYRAKIRKFFRALGDLPRSQRFDIDIPEDADDCEAIVVGSDEVWNLSHPWYGGKRAFYGEGLHARRLVSYAASVGNSNPDNGYQIAWLKRLCGFSQISVRDETSRKTVRAALGAEVPIVLDPCLQFPEPTEAAATPGRAPYVLVYGHSFPDGFAAAVRSWASERRLVLLSVGYRNDWADEQLIAAGPADFPALVANAFAVATNFFHGCVFALRHNRPFACVSSDYRQNKLHDLVHTVGAERHLVRGDAGVETLEPLLGEPPAPAIAERIAALRQQSQAFLDHALP
jgi:hypothetical protein